MAVAQSGVGGPGACHCGKLAVYTPQLVKSFKKVMGSDRVEDHIMIYFD
jgi:hypothetical protein